MRQKFAPKLPKIARYSYVKCNNSNSIQYFNIFLCFSETAYLGTMILSKKVVIEPTAGVNEAKICPKIAENCKYSNLQCNNSNIFSTFQHIFVFLRKCISGYHHFKQKSGHRTNSWSE